MNFWDFLAFRFSSVKRVKTFLKVVLEVVLKVLEVVLKVLEVVLEVLEVVLKVLEVVLIPSCFFLRN